jgi:hypothetical protein
MSTTKRILVYVAGLPVSFLLFATAWPFIAPRMLYHCWDDAPPWMPPFIHPESNSLDGVLRDYYRAPEWVVYTVWFAFIAGVFVLPVLLVWRRSRTGVAHAAKSCAAANPAIASLLQSWRLVGRVADLYWVVRRQTTPQNT